MSAGESFGFDEAEPEVEFAAFDAAALGASLMETFAEPPTSLLVDVDPAAFVPTRFDVAVVLLVVGLAAVFGMFMEVLLD